jgi:hypothetical protein
MAGAGFFYGIHCEHSDGLDAQLVEFISFGRFHEIPPSFIILIKTDAGMKWRRLADYIWHNTGAFKSLFKKKEIRVFEQGAQRPK